MTMIRRGPDTTESPPAGISKCESALRCGYGLIAIAEPDYFPEMAVGVAEGRDSPVAPRAHRRAMPPAARFAASRNIGALSE